MGITGAPGAGFRPGNGRRTNRDRSRCGEQKAIGRGPLGVDRLRSWGLATPWSNSHHQCRRSLRRNLVNRRFEIDAARSEQWSSLAGFTACRVVPGASEARGETSSRGKRQVRKAIMKSMIRAIAAVKGVDNGILRDIHLLASLSIETQ
jgi:hypothetical protein